MKKKIMTNLDYVELYAKKLREDNSMFKQQKMLIESQLKSSHAIFKKMMQGNFKENSRIYLRKIGLL